MGNSVEMLEQLRSRISSQEILPGATLRENDLVAEFRVSRAKVRDVLGVLQERGMVERIPNKGARVSRLESDTAFELFDVREVNEGMCARLATRNSVPDDWKEIAARFRGPIADSVAKGELEDYVVALEDLRQMMIEKADNRLLSDFLDRIHDRTRVLIRRIVILPSRAEQGLKETNRILDAMMEGDEEKAELAKRENIRSAREWFRRYQSFLL